MSAVDTAPAPEGVQDRDLLGTVLRFRAVGIVLALLVLVAVTTAVNPRFLGAQGVRDLLLGASVTVLLAVGLTLVVITRGIDLSVGSTLGLSAFVTGSVLEAAPALGVPGGMVVGLLVGAACGGVNALVIAVGGVPPLVATLGTLYVFRGIVYFVAGGSRISASDLPSGFLAFGTARLLGVPILFLVALVVLAVAAVHLGQNRSGRDLYAIGSNPEAARLAGVATTRRLVGAYVACGALAGLGGVLYAARFGTVDASAGSGLELQVVAAVVVGGVAIFGGSGSVVGAALGALLLTVIGYSLPVLGIDQFWSQAIVGALILAAIGLDRVVSLRAASSSRAKASHVR